MSVCHDETVCVHLASSFHPQAHILGYGLAVHEKFVPQDMRPLHKKLVDQFHLMKSSLGIQVSLKNNIHQCRKYSDGSAYRNDCDEDCSEGEDDASEGADGEDSDDYDDDDDSDEVTVRMVMLMMLVVYGGKGDKDGD